MLALQRRDLARRPNEIYLQTWRIKLVNCWDLRKPWGCQPRSSEKCPTRFSDMSTSLVIFSPGSPLDRYTGETLDLFRAACNQYNKAIVELGEQAHRAARLFNFTIKNHALEHVALDSSELNPAWCWTFASEGFLAKVRKLVQASCHGSAPGLVHKKVMKRYVKALGGALVPGWKWIWKKAAAIAATACFAQPNYTKEMSAFPSHINLHPNEIWYNRKVRFLACLLISTFSARQANMMNMSSGWPPLSQHVEQEEALVTKHLICVPHLVSTCSAEVVWCECLLFVPFWCQHGVHYPMVWWNNLVCVLPLTCMWCKTECCGAYVLFIPSSWWPNSMLVNVWSGLSFADLFSSSCTCMKTKCLVLHMKGKLTTHGHECWMNLQQKLEAWLSS